MNAKTLVYGELKNLGKEIAKTLGATSSGQSQIDGEPVNSDKSQIDGQPVNVGKPFGSLAIITDENVAELYLDACVESLENQGFRVFCNIIPPGEASKNGSVYLSLLERMARDGITRTDGVVALGGGVVGDLAGFVAATYMRGIKVYQVPTTLLAMVDSSIGGKTGIDLQAGKNLAGAFHQPSLIFQDQSLLATLPDDEFMNGMAEVIKCGVLEGGEFFDLLSSTTDRTPALLKKADASDHNMLKDADADSLDMLKNADAGSPDILKNADTGSPALLNELIRRSAEYKIKIVAQDEKDTGIRQILNLGHTFGHAIEKLSNYEIKHGFAVAKGMSLIAEISAKRGWCDDDTQRQITGILSDWGYDLEIPYSMEEMLDVIAVDKKRKGDFIDLVVPVAIGRCVLQRIPVAELHAKTCK